MWWHCKYSSRRRRGEHKGLILSGSQLFESLHQAHFLPWDSHLMMRFRADWAAEGLISFAGAGRPTWFNQPRGTPRPVQTTPHLGTESSTPVSAA